MGQSHKQHRFRTCLPYLNCKGKSCSPLRIEFSWCFGRRSCLSDYHTWIHQRTIRRRNKFTPSLRSPTTIPGGKVVNSSTLFRTEELRRLAQNTSHSHRSDQCSESRPQPNNPSHPTHNRLHDLIASSSYFSIRPIKIMTQTLEQRIVKKFKVISMDKVPINVDKIWSFSGIGCKKVKCSNISALLNLYF